MAGSNKAVRGVSALFPAAAASERVGMRHEFGFQFEFRRSRQVQSITISEFSISDLSSFGEEESSIPVSSSAQLGFRRWKASLVELVLSEYFGRSISDVVLRPEYFVRSGYWNGSIRCDPGVGRTPE